MSKYFICCEKCFDDIGRRNNRAARLWMELCSLTLSKGEIIHLPTQDFPELRDLEMMGFVVSTERTLIISLRIVGHIKTEDGQDFFCIKEGRHD